MIHSLNYLGFSDLHNKIWSNMQKVNTKFVNYKVGAPEDMFLDQREL